jgi:hypothetical protein
MRAFILMVVLAMACGGPEHATVEEPWHIEGGGVSCPGATVQPVGASTLCDWACVDYQGAFVRLSALFDGPSLMATSIAPCS